MMAIVMCPYRPAWSCVDFSLGLISLAAVLAHSLSQEQLGEVSITPQHPTAASIRPLFPVRVDICLASGMPDVAYTWRALLGVCPAFPRPSLHMATAPSCLACPPQPQTRWD